MFNATDRPCRFTLPGTAPQTVVVHRAFNHEEDLVLTFNLQRLRRAESLVGRDIDDPAVVRKMAQAERAALASAIVSVENLHEPGDSTEDKAAIEAFLAALPLASYAAIKEAMMNGLSLFEGKA